MKNTEKEIIGDEPMIEVEESNTKKETINDEPIIEVEESNTEKETINDEPIIEVEESNTEKEIINDKSMKKIQDSFDEVAELLGLSTGTGTSGVPSKDIKIDDLYTFENFSVNYVDGEHFKHNRIIFGAPGTGKSYLVNTQKEQLLNVGSQKEYFERVTFHPEYSYSQFVGTYKPVTDSMLNIEYKFVPGPFMRLLVKALKNKLEAKDESEVKPYLLVIEEINRANVAAVFGEVFQLLDRDSNNNSQYDIQTTEDMRTYLQQELGGRLETIIIPNNMYIWATMNSSDQNVIPMDTAFKRRWDFTYIDIDDNEDNDLVVNIDFISNQPIKWNSLRKAINTQLLCYKVTEDKLLGPYFISKSELDKANEFSKTNPGKIDKNFKNIFKNKVLMYLYDDAAKQKRLSLFDACINQKTNNVTFSEICKKFDEVGTDIFCSELKSYLGDNS